MKLNASSIATAVIGGLLTWYIVNKLIPAASDAGNGGDTVPTE